MAKSLTRRWNRGQKSLQLYGCNCGCMCECGSCQGCGSVPSYDNLNVRSSHSSYVSGNLGSAVGQGAVSS